jgi:hypothetical protein
MDDSPRVLFGILGAGHAGLWFYTYWANSYASNYGFSFENWYTSTRTVAFLFAILFSLTQAVSWGISYVDTLTMLIAFYNWSQINMIFYISAYWLAFLFNVLHLATRANSSSSSLPDSDDDWSETLLFSQLIVGAITISLGYMYTERFDIWYKK